MFRLIGGALVYGFAIYGLIKLLKSSTPEDVLVADIGRSPEKKSASEFVRPVDAQSK